jgi:His Kinase A (phospho-acceptor) domain
VLLAIAGHDLRQPLQVIQGAHDFLGLSIRTESELRLLRSGQTAIDRLRDQLDQLLAAIRLREHAEGLTLAPIPIEPLFRRACHENEIAALKKGVSVRTVPTKPQYTAMRCFSALSCATWLATPSNTPNPVGVFSSVAAMSVRTFVLTCMTLELASLRTKCLEFSRPSLGSTRRDAMVWGSAYSLCVRPSAS